MSLSLTQTPSGCLYVDGSQARHQAATCHDGTYKTTVTPGQLVIEAYYKFRFDRQSGAFNTHTLCWNDRCLHPWHRVPQRPKKYLNGTPEHARQWRAAQKLILEATIPGVATAFDPRIACFTQHAFATLAAQGDFDNITLYLAWAELLKADYRNQRYHAAGKTPRAAPLSDWLPTTRPDLASFSKCGVPDDIHALEPDDWAAPFPCGLESKAISFVDA